MRGTRRPAVDDDRRRRLWLRAAALQPPEQAITAWRAWRAAFDTRIVDPASSRWLPLAWHNLRDAPLDSTDREMLRDEYRRAWLTNQHALDVASSVIAALGDAGIRTLLLKGAALALTTYERAGLRPIGDVDVLVEPDRGPAAREVLEKSGWVPIRDLSPAALGNRASLGYTGSQGVDVDLHWHSLTDCCAADADRGFWHRARPLRLGEATTHVLSPADQLLHVCAHGRRATPIPSAHWMADAVTIVRRSGEDLDWQGLVAEARARSLSIQLRRALDVLLSEDLLRLPASVMAVLETVAPAWWEPVEDRAKQARWPPPLPSLVVQLGCRLARGRAMDGAAARQTSISQLARQSTARLLRSPHGTSRSFDAYGRVVRIAADRGVALQELMDAVEDRLPPFDRLRYPGDPARAYRVVPMAGSRPPEPGFRVLVNNRALAVAGTLDDVAAQIVNDLQTYFALVLSDRTLLHAGVVSLHGRALVLPGVSGSGKSTLVSALLELGATYLSDEFAMLDAAGRVWPYPRPLRLRDATHAAGGAHRTARAPAGAPAGRLLFTLYRPDGRFDPRPLSRASAILRLLRHCPSAEARPAEALAALRALVDAAPAWETERGEANRTAVALTTYARGRRASLWPSIVK